MAEPLPHYHLLTAGTAAELSELVNQHLQEGYDVLGAPFSSPAGTVAILQAVVKYRNGASMPSPAPSSSSSKNKLGFRSGGPMPFQAKNSVAG